MQNKNSGKTKKSILDFNKNNVYTSKSPKGYGYTCFAKKRFKPGDVVMKGFGRKINHQTSHTSIQIGLDIHYIGDKWTGKYWNHSCNPNTYINTRSDGFPNLVVARNIEKDEEITYAYWMTELKWHKGANEYKLKCKCRESNCRGNIFSFSELSRKEQSQLVDTGRCSKYMVDIVS